LELDKDAKGLVVVQIVQGSPADIIGVKQGDRITAVNGTAVGDIASFYKVLREKTNDELWFGVQRGDSAQDTMKFKR